MATKRSTTPLKPQTVDSTFSPKQLDAKRKAVRVGKIDWASAYRWYLEDATRTYSDVAKQFGVATRSVEVKAKITLKDGSWETWAERRLKLGDIARKKAEDDYKKTVPARNEEHLKQYRNLQIATSNKIAMLANQGEWVVNPKTGKKFKLQEFDTRQLSDAAKALKIGIDGERVVMGQPTSVSTIKPGTDSETGKGWGELLALAMARVAEDDNE